ncbi:MAG: flagellar hook-length control protein FliK [Marinobacter sp.]|nr:flagellar hook-length control protein FliK [Marinobacter sp.]
MINLPDGSRPPPTESSPAADRSALAATNRTTPNRELAMALDQLQLLQRQQVLARVAEVITEGKGELLRVLLDIKGQSLTTLLEQSALQGTRLTPDTWIKVMRSGNELRLLELLGTAPQARLPQALAEHLPWQHRLDSGLAPLLTALATGARNPSGPGTLPLPAAAQQVLRELLTHLPGQPPAGTASEPLPTPQVRQWLSFAGAFSEATLTRQGNAENPDLKLMLGRLAQVLLTSQGESDESFNRYRPLTSNELLSSGLQYPLPLSPPLSRSEPPSVGQMLRLIAGMLNRIAVNQLHSLLLSARASTEAVAPQSWVIDLPWLNAHDHPRVAQLRLDYTPADDREQGSEERKPRIAQWVLNLSLELDDAGPLHFEVKLAAGQLATRIWAEQATTLQRVRAGAEGLRARLQALGLEVTSLDCLQGAPKPQPTRLEQRLVDIKA